MLKQLHQSSYIIEKYFYVMSASFISIDSEQEVIT